MIKSVPGRLTPAIATAMILLAGCASGPPEDVTLKGRMEAVATVNPDGQGRPSPLVIKIYQLKAKDKFELAEFFPLFDQPEATLGADMLAVEDLMMVPGEVRPFEGEFDPQTRFIGVIASFRNINQAQWRSVVPMPERNVTKFLKRGGLNIKAESLSITVSIDD